MNIFNVHKVYANQRSVKKTKTKKQVLIQNIDTYLLGRTSAWNVKYKK